MILVPASGSSSRRREPRSGLAGEALAGLVTVLFADHALHRVVAHTDDRNTAGRRLLERLGVRRAARLVDADSFEGEWTTLLGYAVLARQWTRE